jgi:hypothetical protein
MRDGKTDDLQRTIPSPGSSTIQSHEGLNPVIFSIDDHLAKDVISISIMFFMTMIIREIRLLVKECNS